MNAISSFMTSFIRNIYSEAKIIILIIFALHFPRNIKCNTKFCHNIAVTTTNISIITSIYALASEQKSQIMNIPIRSRPDMICQSGMCTVSLLISTRKNTNVIILNTMWPIELETGSVRWFCWETIMIHWSFVLHMLWCRFNVC